MDDLKISHTDSDVVNEVITSLCAKYGKVGEMIVRRGNKHDYIGVTLVFCEDGKFLIDMEEYLDEILSGLPKDINGRATTPAADNLSKTHNVTPKLNKERAELFHRFTAQTLCMAQCDSPDLQTVISFLTK